MTRRKQAAACSISKQFGPMNTQQSTRSAEQGTSMPSFEDLFLKSKGQPVVYNGRTIQMVDRLRVHDGQLLKVTFESVNADWRQGVCLSTDIGFVVNRFASRHDGCFDHAHDFVACPTFARDGPDLAT